ncbi:50S ribosomal protein L29, partial [Peptostreptococcus stomatis]
ELFSLRFQLATGQLQNTAIIKTVKRDIAKVKTVLAERKLNEARA